MPRRATHPEVMQMSFANQFMSALYVLKNHATLGKKVLDVPEDIENQVALASLESLGISIGKHDQGAACDTPRAGSSSAAL